jgi:hypothetical protein
VNANLVKEDRDRAFADWGVTVALRRVSQTYDPQSGAVTESYDDRRVRAIVGDGEVGAADGTAGQAGETQQEFAVRNEDVNAESDLRTMRIMHQGREYRIHDVESGPQASVTILRCSLV